MKILRTIFGNRWVVLGLILYAGSLALLWRNKDFGREDAISELILFGFAFPLLAWFATIRARPLSISLQPSGYEMILLAAALVAVSLYLVFGNELISSILPESWLASSRIMFFVTLCKKLLVFVVIPFVLFHFLFGYSIKDFGLQRAGLKALFHDHLPAVLVLSGAILLFQYFLGNGAAPLRRGEFNAHQLLLGLPLCFGWLILEVGLVEEFFFRALVQSRLAGWFRSEVSGVALMALIFGLAHAPGFILRHAGTAESLGPNPSVGDSIAYSIVVLSVGGIFLGIVWARTKNLFAVMIIHAAADLLPNVSEFIRTWKI